MVEKIGQSRFPRFTYMAADLLSIPSSTAHTERQFNSTGIMLTPVRNRLRPIIVNQGQYVSNWLAEGVYQPSLQWQKAQPAFTANLEELGTSTPNLDV
jgi:hypothetical protein